MADDDLAYLRYAWGGAYQISVSGGRWRAVPTSPRNEVVEADSADELLYLIRRCYR